MQLTFLLTLLSLTISTHSAVLRDPNSNPNNIIAARGEPTKTPPSYPSNAPLPSKTKSPHQPTEDPKFDPPLPAIPILPQHNGIAIPRDAPQGKYVCNPNCKCTAGTMPEAGRSFCGFCEQVEPTTGGGMMAASDVVVCAGKGRCCNHGRLDGRCESGDGEVPDYAKLCPVNQGQAVFETMEEREEDVVDVDAQLPHGCSWCGPNQLCCDAPPPPFDLEE